VIASTARQTRARNTSRIDNLDGATPARFA
jgi:hypothetical protein